MTNRLLAWTVVFFVFCIISVSGLSGSSFNWVRQNVNNTNTDFCASGVCAGSLDVHSFNVSANYTFADFFCLNNDLPCISAWPSGGGTSSIFIDNATTENCSANHYLYGIAPNGSGYCRADNSGGGGSINWGWENNTDSSVTQTSLKVSIGDNLTVDTNVFHVDTTANLVGVGTNKPARKFHVNSGNADVGIRLESTDSSAKIELKDTSGTVTLESINNRFRINRDVNLTMGLFLPSLSSCNSGYSLKTDGVGNVTCDIDNDSGNSTADIANALVSIIHVGDNSSIYLYTNGTYFWLNLQSFNTTTDHRIDLKYHDNSTSDIEAVIDANYHDNSTSDVLTVVNPLLDDINLSVKAYNSTQNDSITSAYTSAISSSNESLWVHSYSNLLNLSGNDVVIGDVRMVGDIWLTTDSDSTYIVTDNFKCNKSCILNMTTFEGVSNFNSPMFISADSAPVGAGIVGWGSPNNFWKSIYSLLFVSNMSGGLTDTYDLRVRNNAIVDGTFDVGKNSSIGNISLDRHSVIVIPYDDSTSFKIGETKSGTIGFVSIPYNPNIDYPVFSSQAGASLTGLFFGDKIKAKRNNVTSFYIDLTGGGNGNINLTGSSGKIQARDYISEDGSVGATNTNNVYICTSPSGTGCNNWVQVDIKDGLFIG